MTTSFVHLYYNMIFALPIFIIPSLKMNTATRIHELLNSTHLRLASSSETEILQVTMKKVECGSFSVYCFLTPKPTERLQVPTL